MVANGTGAAVRADLNNQLAAVFTNHSGSSEPSTTYAYQFWADTTANVLKLRNSANNGWITLRELDGTMLLEDGSASTPGLAFADDVNTGLFSPAADSVAVSTGGTERVRITSTGAIAIEGASNYGTSGQILTSNGNDAPTWQDAASTDSDKITEGNTTVECVDTGSDGHITFDLEGSEQIRIDTQGHILSGITSRVGPGVAPADANSTEIGKGYINLSRDDTAAVDHIQFGKNGSIASSIGTSTSNSLVFKTGTTERMRILSGGGLTFNGDTATANALNDYEEGTWTPTTYSDNLTFDSATYVKVGKMVTAHCSLTGVTSYNASTGNPFIIFGWPFVTQSGNSDYTSATGSCKLTNMNSSITTGTLSAVMRANNTRCRMQKNATNAADSFISLADVGTGSFSVVINVTYYTT